MPTEREEQNLKPCPFCGDTYYLVVDDHPGAASVLCDACDVEGPMRQSKTEAVTAWNRRAEGSGA
ncbi:MAG: Lar family restriction alleviation protein [Planctomycetota bacterium]